MIQIFGHKKCRLTRKAERFFKERGVRIQMIDILSKPMSAGELVSVVSAVGVERLYDGQGARARERGLHHAAPSKARMLELLSEDMKLLVTPVVRKGRRACVGDDEAGWKALLSDDRPAL